MNGTRTPYPGIQGLSRLSPASIILDKVTKLNGLLAFIYVPNISTVVSVSLFSICGCQYYTLFKAPFSLLPSLENNQRLCDISWGNTILWNYFMVLDGPHFQSQLCNVIII